MDLAILLGVFSIFVVVNGEFLDILSVCDREPFIWRCSFMKEGIYTSENAVKVKKLEWDRLQNSAIDLKKFPNLIGLKYGNSPFDHFSPCDHIINIRQTVTVEEERDGQIVESVCVSITSLVNLNSLLAMQNLQCDLEIDLSRVRWKQCLSKKM